MAWTRKPKIHIETVRSSNEGEIVAYYAKGRFSPGEFLSAVETYSGKKLSQRPTQEFWVNVPAEGGDLDVLFKKCTVFTKGAYAVTVVDLESWDR